MSSSSTSASPLFIGGLDTVSALLDCFFAFLAEHPAHRRQIVQDPSLIPGAIEELLRFEAPVMITSRTSRRIANLAVALSRPGDNLSSCSMAASNTDEEGFPDAGEVRFDRREFGTSPSVAGCTDVWAPIWPGSSCGPPCGRGTRGSLTTGSSRAWSSSSLR